MKTVSLFFASALVAFMITSCKPQTATQPAEVKTDISEFVGQWTIDVQGGGVSWLEVTQANDYLDGKLLWVGGSVLPVSSVFLAKDRVLMVQRESRTVVREKDANNATLKTSVFTVWLEVVKNGDKIEGVFLNPKNNGTGVDSARFTGTKLPASPAAPDLSKVKFGDPVQLFNGKDLAGWKLINEKNTSGWTVKDGVLSNNPVQTEGQPHIAYGNLRTEQEFEDFNLKLEVNIPAGSNSGVYLKGMYEIQVVDSYGKALDSHNMGGLYSRVCPTVSAEKPAGQWQSMEMTLCDRYVTVVLNGVKIIDNQPAYGPTGGAIISDVFKPGPIYLQGDHGTVNYRNIVLTPIIK
ncbi:MAG: DUF1080 domain-containing protein [Bacteroidota bacterium]